MSANRLATLRMVDGTGFLHDGDPLSMNSANVAVLKHPNLHHTKFLLHILKPTTRWVPTPRSN